MREVAGTTAIDCGPNDIIIVKDVAMSSFTAADFLLT